MLVFHCHSCNEKVRVSLEKLYRKDFVQCQNCDQFFPNEILFKLKQGGYFYSEAQKALEPGSNSKAGWNISLCDDKGKVIDALGLTKYCELKHVSSPGYTDGCAEIAIKEVNELLKQGWLLVETYKTCYDQAFPNMQSVHFILGYPAQMNQTTVGAQE